MEYRKGLGLGTILKLTLALMVASLFISVSTLGEIGKLVDEGMSSVQNASDFTIEVRNVQRLSDAAKYVRQRAGNGGCQKKNHFGWNTVYQQNQEGGYPALEGTYLTATPNCLGTASTLAKGDGAVDKAKEGFIRNTGQDQEGLYSRVRFEVKSEVVIETSESTGENTWLENRIAGVSNMSLQENVMTSTECMNMDGSGDIPAEKYLGAGEKFVIYFQPEEASEEPYRSDKFMQEFAGHLNNRVYCHPNGAAYGWKQLIPPIEELDQHPLISATRRLENKVVLCPGDRGYIQMNKAKPLHFDEASEGLFTGSAANFPYIQITHLGTKDGTTCQSAEMSPAATFDQVKTAQRIQLPLGAGQQIAAMIPDEFENTVRGFVEGYWEPFADQAVDAVENSGVAGRVLSDLAGAVGKAVGDLGKWLGGVLGDAPKTIANALDEAGLNPLTDMVGKVFDVAEDAIDGTMKDSLHLELTFTNHHLDMDDDAYYGVDPRGGFKINMWKGGNDQNLNGKFETEPLGGLYHEDVPQGQIGAGELDALQSGWNPVGGDGGIEDLGCYVKAELLLEQKEDSKNYPERAEQVWTIWIGDLVDQEGPDRCSRNGRIDGRAGIAWGGTSTLNELDVEVVDYHPGENKLEVSATATANSQGDANIDGGKLDLGYQTDYTFHSIDFVEDCEGSSCSISLNLTDVGNNDFKMVKARFERDSESTQERVYADVSNYISPEKVLGPEEWSWNSAYNSTTEEFNVTVKYGDIAADREHGLEGGIMALDNVSSDTEEIGEVNCGDTGEYTECIIERNEISPAADGELDLNATINKNGLKFWDTKTISP